MVYVGVEKILGVFTICLTLCSEYAGREAFVSRLGETDKITFLLPDKP